MFVKQHFFPNILNSKWLVWKPTNFIYQLRFKWNWLDSLNQQTWMLPNVDTLWLVDPVVNIQKIRCCGACTSGALNVRSRERWSIESKYTSFGRFWVEDNDDMQVVILIWCSCDVAVAIYVKHAFRYVVVTSTSPANWGCHICISWVGEIMYGIIHTDKCIYIYIWVFEFLRPTSSVLFRPKVQATPSCSFLRVWLYIYIYISQNLSGFYWLKRTVSWAAPLQTNNSKGQGHGSYEIPAKRYLPLKKGFPRIRGPTHLLLCIDYESSVLGCFGLWYYLVWPAFWRFWRDCP